MGVQASQNRIARKAPHPGLSRWEAGCALPSHATSNCSPAGLVPAEARFADWHIADSWANRRSSGASPEGTILSSACGSAETQLTGTRPAEATPFLKGNSQFKTGQTARIIHHLAEGDDYG